MLQNIPAELRSRRQWVAAQDDKVPRTPRTGKKADPSDPTTWGTFEEALETGMKHVGYVLAPDDPYSAIDLDAPITSEQCDRHSAILDECASYAEISQSGNGVHIFVRGKIPHGVRRDKVEVYSSGRYMICTGNVLNALPIVERQEVLNVLYREMSSTSKADLVEEDELLADSDLAEMATNAANGDKFDRLWQGEWEGDYPSQSEADLALMSMLCYYSKANEQCRRLFLISKLGQRDKAHRRKYLDYMIEKCRAKEPPRVDLEAIRNPKKKVPNVTVHTNPPHTETKSGLESAVASGQTEFGIIADDVRFASESPGQGAVTFPPGLVGAIADYAMSSAIRPVPEIALATALALTAGICGRSYNVSGTGLNQYIILLARTGSGKEGCATAIDALVAAMRPTIPMADRFIGPAVFASGQGLLRFLGNQPCFVSILGEFGTTLQMLSDPRANDGTKALKRVLLDIYNKSGWNKLLKPSVYSDTDKNTQTVQAPNVTFLGESTPEEFYDHLDASHVTSGLLPRCSVIEYDGPRPKLNSQAFHPPSERLISELGDLVTLALSTAQNRTCCPVQVDDEAEGILKELNERADHEINSGGEIDRQLWNRAHMKALKLGALVAVGNDPQNPVVGRAEVEWAREFVAREIALIAGKFAEGNIGQGQSKQEVDLRIAINDYLGMSAARRKTYKIPDSLVNEKLIVPYHYLRRRTRLLASYKNDRRGASVALDATLDSMVLAETLTRIDRRTANESFGCSQPLYARGATF